jgi:hypothetical protein
MIQIKSLADFKRAIKVGAKVQTHHAKFGDMGVRTISIAQSNSFALATNKVELIEIEPKPSNQMVYCTGKFLEFTEDKFLLHQQNIQFSVGDIVCVTNDVESVYICVISSLVDSWCEYPKSKDIECNGTNEVAIFWGDGANREKILTYTFLD